GTRRAFQTRARRATHSGIPRPDPNDPQGLTVAPMVVTPGRDGVLWDAGQRVTGEGSGGSQVRATPTSAVLAKTYPGCARSSAAAQALAPIVTTSLRGRPRGRLYGTPKPPQLPPAPSPD